LRVALAPVFAAATVTPPIYTDPILVPGMIVKAVHLSEIRIAVSGIE
jgi:hypothetical protein